MPPANSRSHSPVSMNSPNLSTTPNSLISSLRQNLQQLENIAVTDLASTLNTTFPQSQAERERLQRLRSEEAEEADLENVSFLRSGLAAAQDAQEEWRAENAERDRQTARGLDGIRDGERQRLRELYRNRRNAQAMEAAARNLEPSGTPDQARERRERLQRMLNGLNRIQNGGLPGSSGRPGTVEGQQASYGARDNSENSLYDWSPADHTGRPQWEATFDALPSDTSEADELRIYNYLRQSQPHINEDVHRQMAMRWRESGAAVPRSSTRNVSTATQSNEPSLRSQAITQAMRRHPRFTARARDVRDTTSRLNTDINNAAAATAEARDRVRELHARVRSTIEGIPRVPSTTSTTARQTVPTQNEIADVSEVWRQAFIEYPETQSREDDRDRSGYRRAYLNNPARVAGEVQRLPEPTPWLQQTIEYLARLRNCFSRDDALEQALVAGLATKEFLGENYADFLTNVDCMSWPAPTTWLAPGAVFSGTQHAPNAIQSRRSRRQRGTSRTNLGGILDEFDPSNPWRDLRDGVRRPGADLAGLDHTADGISSGGLNERDNVADKQARTVHPDRWPVKVTIHAVDYNNMTIAATMEAYNVPSYTIPTSNTSHERRAVDSGTSVSAADTSMDPDHTPAGFIPSTSSITTYLEGEILDLANHTFLTESYQSSRATDAAYWRKLEPFARLASDDDMVRMLVSRRRMRELGDKYVLMRWKERCFVPKSETSVVGSVGPAPPEVMAASFFGNGGSGGAAGSAGAAGERPWLNSGDGVMADAGEGCGLTISGFYYVALRRSDGAVEGLYCDPESSPYQHLKLTRALGGFFPTWEFT